MKIRIKNIICLLIPATVLIILFSCTTLTKREKSFTPDQYWLDGTWVGTGYQFDPLDNWLVRLTVNNAQKQFMIEYPSLECGGSWHPVDFGSDRIVFIEKIDYGKEQCVDGGTIVITKIDSSAIVFSYFLPNNQPGAMARLEKK